ncbi:MAG: hypothetical protein GPOALKHO_000452 [Sodalis sp.]|nr:MAG: hypothetical protein GPOALKHO_000452 [Sodalis sp.]
MNALGVNSLHNRYGIHPGIRHRTGGLFLNRASAKANEQIALLTDQATKSTNRAEG